MKKFAIAGLVSISAIALSTIWFINSPRFALYSLGSAIDTSDEQAVLQYLDTEALSKQIADIYIKQNKLKALQSNNSSAEMVGTTIGLGMVEVMRPALEAKLHQTFLQTVTVEVQKQHSDVAIKLLATDITSSGDKAIARIVFSSGKRIPMNMKREDGRWRIVGGDSSILAPIVAEMLD